MPCGTVHMKGDRTERWLGVYARARPVLLAAASCLLVHAVLAALLAWPNALVPNFGYALRALLAGDAPSWWLPALRFMIDDYAAALLGALVVAGLYVGRGGATRRACALLLTMSALWWGLMVGLRLISMTSLGWQPM